MNEDRKKALRYLKTCRGQIDGIIKMIEDERYCIDIANQIAASTSLLKKANKSVLEGHMKGCIRTAIETGDVDEKIDELVWILNKLIDK